MISKHELRQMYYNKGMTKQEIADEIGVHLNTINNWMKKYCISPRTLSESKLIGIRVPSKDELQYMYCDEGMSMAEIAKEIGVYPSTVRVWMTKTGI